MIYLYRTLFRKCGCGEGDSGCSLCGVCRVCAECQAAVPSTSKVEATDTDASTRSDEKSGKTDFNIFKASSYLSWLCLRAGNFNVFVLCMPLM